MRGRYSLRTESFISSVKYRSKISLYAVLRCGAATVFGFAPLTPTKSSPSIVSSTASCFASIFSPLLALSMLSAPQMK